MKTIISTNEKDTLKLGYDLATNLKGGSIVLLDGSVGAGKSVIARGIARGLGINGDVCSPTFTLANTYNLINGLVLCHIDAYRIKNEDEALEAGLGDFIGSCDTITLIEWHKNIKRLVTHYDCVFINIQVMDSNMREIIIRNITKE